MTVAAALLLTAVADSAPVSRQTHSRMALCRDERLPRFEVEFEVEIAARRFVRRAGRFLGDGGAAEVGVQDDAGGVDDRHAVSAAMSRSDGDCTRPAMSIAAVCRRRVALRRSLRSAASSARMAATITSCACVEVNDLHGHGSACR